MSKISIIFAIFGLSCVFAQYNPHYVGNRTVMVHLMEWKYKDIADECERFLGPKGYAGIQLSPVAECRIVQGRPWWERYQPISYKLDTRSGNQADFLDMTRRCNAAGVRIYVDIILNHMSAFAPGGEGIGTGGSKANPGNRDFPAVPYGPDDFNQPKCDINNWNNPTEVRNCNLVALEDLNQGKQWVRDKLIEHMNQLIDFGVAGFRVDAAKHMWPGDLKIIFDGLKNLNTEFGFAPNSRAFVFQEVIDYGGESISRSEYTDIGAVTDFIFSRELSRAFEGGNQLKWLRNFGEAWGLMPSMYSFCFVDNHDNQRDEDGILTYKRPRPYKMAQAFGMAHPHGQRRIMSSFDFSNRDQGPPADAQGNLISPTINPDDTCGAGWICEHRWRQIYNMADFRNVVGDAPIANWWDNDNNQIAFGRGNRGFIVINGETGLLSPTLNTGLPAGKYCDVISGGNVGGSCTGLEITVNAGGSAAFFLPGNAADGVIAIHVGSNSLLQNFFEPYQ